MKETEISRSSPGGHDTETVDTGSKPSKLEAQYIPVQSEHSSSSDQEKQHMENRPDNNLAGFILPAWAFGVLFLVFFALGWILHSPGFHAPMVYDSRAWILNKEPVFATRSLDQVLSLLPVRPLFMLTLYMNYLCTGMDTYYFRVINVSMLALAGTLLVLFIASAIEIPNLKIQASRRLKQAAAVIPGVWFVIHPLQIFVVLYDWQRSAIMACIFFFGALSAYVAAGSAQFVRPVYGYALTGVLFLAGLMSKENLITLPALLILVDWILFGKNFREVCRRGAAIVLATLLLMTVYLALIGNLHGKESMYVGSGSMVNRLAEHFSGSSISPMQLVLTECRVWVSYLAMIVAPFLEGVHFWKLQSVSISLWEPSVTIAAVMGVLGFIGLGIALARKKPLAAFGILFFVITLLPESFLVPVYLFFGYRAVLPMAGILLILAEIMLSTAVWIHSKRSRIIFNTVGMVVLIVPLLWTTETTFVQAGRWSPLSFWQDGFNTIPQPPKDVETIAYLDVINGLGGELIHSGQYEQAIDVLRLADRPLPREESIKGLNWLNPRKASTLISLGRAHQKSDRPSEAMAYYRRALELDPNSSLAWNNLGSALEAVGDLAAANRHYKKAVELAPNMPELNFNLGSCLAREGKWGEAIPYFKKAVHIKPNYPKASMNLGISLMREGQIETAVPHLLKAAAALTDNVEVYNALGAALAQTGRPEEAIQSFQKALVLQPNHPGAKQNLELLLQETGKSKEKQ